MDQHAIARGGKESNWQREEKYPSWVNGLMLSIWLLAGAVPFLPFALDTSPWDAVTLHVPGNQGNWWHALIGAPFFLAYPMIWLRLRWLFSGQPSTAIGRRLLWCFIGFSVVGTISVEAPFFLHLAGTSEWQRLVVLCLGFGIIFASAALSWTRRRRLSPAQMCLAGLETAYLANASLCLVVYSGAAGNSWSKSGWLVSILVVWPIGVELFLRYLRTFRAQTFPMTGEAVQVDI